MNEFENRISPEGMVYYQGHPIEFIEDQVYCLSKNEIRDNKLWRRIENESKQIMTAVEKYDRVAVRSGHGISKTTTVSWLILWFLYCFENAKIMATGPKFDQLKITLWAEINKWLSKSLIKKDIEWSSEKIFHKDNPGSWFGVIMTSKEGENITGLHSDHQLIVIDEASGVSDSILEAILGCLTGPHNKLLATGNPTKTSGFFAEAFGRDMNLWHTMQFSSENSAIVSQAWLNKMRRKYHEDSDIYRVRVKGLPPKGNPKAIISLEEVHAARDRTVEPGDYLEIGLDPAGEGDDLCACAIRQGLKLLEVRVWPKTKAHEVVAYTLDMLREYRMKTKIRTKVRIKVDDSVTGDVPVIIRRDKRFVDIVPIMTLHNTSSEYSNSHSKIEILSQDGWTDIVWSRRHKVKKMGYDIICGSARTKVTEDHSLVKDRKKIKPKDLSVGKTLDIGVPDIVNDAVPMTDDMAWLCGFFVAEGSLKINPISQGRVVQIANYDMEKLKKCKKILEDVFCKNVSIYKDRVILSGHPFTWFYQNFYIRTSTGKTFIEDEKYKKKYINIKRIPMTILNSSKKIKESFLDGYLDGDGFRSDKEEKSDCKSLVISAGIKYLYHCLGYKTSIRVRNDEKTDITTVAKIKKSWIKDNEIKSMREFFIDDYVYDLETKSHTFIAGVGFLVHHNTGYGQAIRHYLALDTKNNIEVVPCMFGGGGNDEFADGCTIMWHELKDIISDIELPDDDDLIDELSTRERDFVNNKYKAMPKAKFKELIGQSPDRSDSVVLCYTKGPKKVFSRDDHSQSNVRVFGIDWEQRHVLDAAYYGVKMVDVRHYCSMIFQEDLSFSCLCAIYEFIRDELWVYGEMFQDSPIPEVIIPAIKAATRYGIYPEGRDVKIIGNEEMFRYNSTQQPLAKIFQRNNLHVYKPKYYDEWGAVALGTQMYRNGKIIFHENCEQAITEIELWSIKGGRPEKGKGFCMGLLHILSEIRKELKMRPAVQTTSDYRPVHDEYEQARDRATTWMAR